MPPDARTPWHDAIDLNRSWQRVMDVARDHGHRAPWRPSFSENEIAAREAQLGTRFPGELRTYLKLYDRGAWSWFVNPEQDRIGDVRKIVDINGKRITGDHPQNVMDDWCGIDSLDEVVPVTFGTAQDIARSTYEAAVRDGFFAPSLLTSRAIRFDGTHFGENMYFVVGPCQWSEGTLCVSIGDDPGLVWIADSIAHWLARLAAMDGFEPAAFPGGIGDVPKPLRLAYAREFNDRNPHCSWFR